MYLVVKTQASRANYTTVAPPVRPSRIAHTAEHTRATSMAGTHSIGSFTQRTVAYMHTVPATPVCTAGSIPSYSQERCSDPARMHRIVLAGAQPQRRLSSRRTQTHTLLHSIVPHTRTIHVAPRYSSVGRTSTQALHSDATWVGHPAHACAPDDDCRVQTLHHASTERQTYNTNETRT